MRSFFRDTVFGRIANLASGGRAFPEEEQRDRSRLQRYVVKKIPLDSETSTEAGQDNTKAEKIDPERGNDFQLVDWIENDPEVYPL